MKIRFVPADERFDQTAFSNEVVHGEVLGIHTLWRCPRCPQQVRFSKEQFEVRARQRVSNLDVPMRAAFDAWAERHGEASAPFLDWVCPGCGMASRVYVHPWAGGRHGDAGVNLGTVLEIADG